MGKDVVVIEDNATETTEVAAAATEAVADAFAAGASAGADTARREEIDMVPRAEFDALAARVAAVEDAAGVALVVAEAAAEVAVEAAVEADESAVEAIESVEEPTGEPQPPARREAPEGAGEAPKKERRAYGHPGWFR